MFHEYFGYFDMFLKLLVFSFFSGIKPFNFLSVIEVSVKNIFIKNNNFLSLNNGHLQTETDAINFFSVYLRKKNQFLNGLMKFDILRVQNVSEIATQPWQK